MGEASKKLASYDRKRPDLSLQERKALANIRKEARLAGAVLRNGGAGGLAPSLALGIFRRDGFRCKVHGDAGEGENGGLMLHHKGGIIESKWLASKGKSNGMNNLVTLCARAHNDLHDAARDAGTDISQVK